VLNGLADTPEAQRRRVPRGAACNQSPTGLRHTKVLMQRPRPPARPRATPNISPIALTAQFGTSPGPQLLEAVDGCRHEVERIARTERLVKMSWIPASSSTARTHRPMTPVPSEAA